MSLLVHKDDDSNDLSDLGIGTSSDKSSVSEDYANDDNHSMVSLCLFCIPFLLFSKEKMYL